MATIRKLRDLWDQGISSVQRKRRRASLNRRNRSLLLESLERRDLLSVEAAFVVGDEPATIASNGSESASLTVALSAGDVGPIEQTRVELQILSGESTPAPLDLQLLIDGAVPTPPNSFFLNLEPGTTEFSFDVQVGEYEGVGDREVVLEIVGGDWSKACYDGPCEDLAGDVAIGSPSTATITILDASTTVVVTGDTELNEGDFFDGTVSLPDSSQVQPPWYVSVDSGRSNSTTVMMKANYWLGRRACRLCGVTSTRTRALTPQL